MSIEIVVLRWRLNHQANREVDWMQPMLILFELPRS
jgi:hypothetical protein